MPHNGNGAVPQGDHLRQAAGLALAGHQEEIGSGVDLPGKGGHKPAGKGHLLRVPPLHLPEEFLIAVLAVAQYDDLHPHAQHILHGVAHQVKALVAHQAAYHGQDGGIGFFRQVHLLLQGGLAQGLALRLSRREISGQGVIPGGIVANGINAIEDAAQLPLLLPQDLIQPMAKIGVEDLAGIGGAYGGDALAFLQGALHHIQVPVEFHLTDGPIRQAAHIPGYIQPKLPLILDIMNGKDGMRPGELGNAPVEHIEVNRDKSGLPVIAVDDIRLIINVG